MSSRLVLSLLFGCFSLVILGCGPPTIKTVPVTGKVTLDGTPVPEAVVTFIPEQGPLAQGKTDAGGAFTLSLTVGERPPAGAVPGNYKITVQKTKSSGISFDPASQVEQAPGAPQIEYLVPEKYSRPDTSGFTAEVKVGMPPVPLNLLSAP